MDIGRAVDTSSNEIWIDADCYEDFETTRPLLFRDDMRETFFRWFRIKPTDRVLDGGCATGVLTRFIAKGLTAGSVTGFDISRNFVDYGNKKIAREGLSGKAEIVREDGFALSFADGMFDAVVNHAYLGVLSDNEAGLAELIRVCKVGGRVSVSVSARSFPGIHWAGDSPFPGEARLEELTQKHELAYRSVATPVALKQDAYWNVYRFPRMFAKNGLKDITIHPYASGFSYNDSYWSDDFKQYRIRSGIGREIEILREQLVDPQYANQGFSRDDFMELMDLYMRKQEYLLASMKNDDCWEWEAKLHYIVTGEKVSM
jgi:ubiquinone/menaquinone biosynthesis C-methylase UbiE